MKKQLFNYYDILFILFQMVNYPNIHCYYLNLVRYNINNRIKHFKVN